MGARTYDDTEHDPEWRHEQIAPPQNTSVQQESRLGGQTREQSGLDKAGRS